ncbi:SusD/RagB family nutrient-binding outer membrane lipoprotein [Mucilaginibacter sp. FT3.2]|uniref:SusD/RagB family nutrient-binding outer membrane lipoprotein n=1 Tax=Mucilaginibacter sp. FT3.2 TaxID=2723090 RepID=UPI001616F860|nr:SusD/RagB family nutrient-binding outer membrane lipoprotein [Mucilaginibacter sp. FT3.2]MBB6230831.1 hypothetical protein [Mucilaginibacter sp. FT3.2]
MKTKSIFKRKVNLSLLFSAVILTSIVGCKKGTFDINDVNPNSPTSAPAQYSLSSSLAATATLVQGGNADVLNNWMGYWTQSGGFTASTTYVLYQLTSSNYVGNFDNAYLNLSNYNLLLKTVGSSSVQANYKAIATIMEVFVYQRLVDLYNSVPYSQALIVNPTFSYKYDDPKTIYTSLVAKCDSVVNLIAANPNAVSPGSYDVMFGGDMTKWTAFAKTLKLKLLMRQTQGGLGSAGVKAALSTATAADYLTVDALINPGYSNAADNQVNPFYLDVIANSQGKNGTNTTYWRANTYAIKFLQDNNDPRLFAVYAPIGTEAVAYTAQGSDKTKYAGRVYGSTSGTETNTVISAVVGTGFDYSTGKQKGPSQGAAIISLSETLFLVAEAQQRGYIAGDAGTTYAAAVAASFKFVGVPNYAAAATTYIGQGDNLTNYATSTDKLTTLITQKWAAMNSVDPLESYSDWRRLGIPRDLPVSIFPGNTATHIPYRLPYTINETSLNSANVPAGGTGNDVQTSKIFWMP